MLTDREKEVCGILARLLDYPGAYLARDISQYLEKLKTCSTAQAKAVEPFVVFCRDHSPEAIQEIYTQTFDMDPSTTLYIGHYLFGETAKRNTFMMKLNEEYQAIGAFSIGSELPDNLGMVLRFLGATHNEEFARPLIHDGIIPALDGLCKNLDKTNNPYVSLVKSIQGFLSGIERETGMVGADV